MGVRFFFFFYFKLSLDYMNVNGVKNKRSKIFVCLFKQSSASFEGFAVALDFGMDEQHTVALPFSSSDPPTSYTQSTVDNSTVTADLMAVLPSSECGMEPEELPTVTVQQPASGTESAPTIAEAPTIAFGFSVSEGDNVMSCKDLYKATEFAATNIRGTNFLKGVKWLRYFCAIICLHDKVS